MRHPLKIQNFKIRFMVGRIANARVDGHAFQKRARGYKTFTWRQSGNTNCGINTMPTVETTGTFSIQNNGIFFEINDSEIIENPSGNPLESSLPRPISESRILSLTENYFEFELTYEGSEPGTFQKIKYQFEKP